MHLMYFTEQPDSAYPEPRDEDGNLGTTRVTFSNKYYNPVEGSRLYNDRLREYLRAEEVGYDGIMLNEHHNAPFCMQSQITVWASILAAATERVKIVLLGTPLPTLENPLAAAESLAMVDMISKGRLVAGIVRGGGSEQLANNVNPAFNRDRFYEAHDLIVKAWTEPGPWRWEGDHYHFRAVNPWARPLQQPHPRIWVPGTASPETIVWCAQQRYPYIALNTAVDVTQQIWKLYDDTAAEAGYEAGPEHRGYLLRVHVADTEEKAVENAKQFMWMQGEFAGVGQPEYQSPSGYFSPTKREQFVQAINHRGEDPRARPFDVQRGSPLDRRRHAGPGGRGAARSHGADAARHLRALGQRRARQPRGRDALHRADRRGGAAAPARDRAGVGPQGSVRDERPGQLATPRSRTGAGELRGAGAACRAPARDPPRDGHLKGIADALRPAADAPLRRVRLRVPGRRVRAHEGRGRCRHERRRDRHLRRQLAHTRADPVRRALDQGARR